MGVTQSRVNMALLQPAYNFEAKRFGDSQSQRNDGGEPWWTTVHNVWAVSVKRCGIVATMPPGHNRAAQNMQKRHSSAYRRHMPQSLFSMAEGRRQKAGKFLHCFWACDDGSDGDFGKTPSCCPSYSTPGRGIFGILESLANHCVSPSLLAVKGP